MESLLGFHPPHFSEEAAWLPGWLQSASNHAFQCSSGQRLEDIGCLQQNMCSRENEDLSDNGGCKSFHLYLSGEDNSTTNFPSFSSNNEAVYHLHLSSNEESQNFSNPILSKSQPERFDFNQAPIVHQPDSKVITHEVNNPSLQKGNSVTSLSSKGQNRKTPKPHKADITDAVELAVAASEALIIHKVVKEEPSTQISTPSSVLEAALRVTQARLESVKVKVKESLGFEESNEVDFLSDLDESTMADAYEDVGLMSTSSTGHGDGYESISHVKDSYADFGCISSRQEPLSNVREPIEGERHREDVDYGVLGSTGNADLGCDVDLLFNCSADFCLKEKANGDPISCQTVLISSECNEREDRITSVVPDRFQSRWFGGWANKNEAAVTNDKHKTDIPPQVFGNETSSLSESADIAPDMNSGIQKQDTTNTLSQSSIAPTDAHNTNLLLEDVHISQSSSPPKSAHNKTTVDENSPCDDVTITESSVAPNISPMDLLCSVVPCSFSSDTLPLPLSPTNHNIMSPNINLDNTEIVSDVLHDKTRLISEINRDSPPVRRQVFSLKTYSMLSYPPYDPYSDQQPPTKTPIQDDHNPTSEQQTELPNNMEKKTKLPITEETPEELPPTNVCEKENYNIKSCLVPKRKRVRFSEPEISYTPVKKLKTRVKSSYSNPQSKSQIKKHRVTMLFQNLNFLLTGFSVKKHKEIKILVHKNGGMVLDDIPSPPTPRTKRHSKYQLPLVLCPKRLLTTKFLYGCAVNACILKVKWLFDSIREGSVLPLKNYMILKERVASCMVIGKPVVRSSFIFENLAIMLLGKRDFCTKMAKVVKHGGGLVFKTIHWLVKRLESNKVLVGAIVVEDEDGISRQLKQCAVEQNIAVMSSDWIVKSLYEGRVVTSKGFKHPSDDDDSLASKAHLELSEEI